MYRFPAFVLAGTLPAFAYDVGLERSVQPDASMQSITLSWTASAWLRGSGWSQGSQYGPPPWACNGPTVISMMTETVTVQATSAEPDVTVSSSSSRSMSETSFTHTSSPSTSIQFAVTTLSETLSSSSMSLMPVSSSTSASTSKQATITKSSFTTSFIDVTTTAFTASYTNATKSASSPNLTTLPSPPATGNVTSCQSSAYQPQNASSSFPNYIGINVVNKIPFDPQTPEAAAGWKTVEDWDLALQLVKDTFPKANAVRIYSTTETGGGVNHLNNSMVAALNTNMKLLVGIWSQPATRFEEEFAALKWVLETTGCDNFAAAVAAVSVGNEDLYTASSNGDGLVMTIADSLVDQITKVREYLRSRGGICCSIPVTHTDTFNMYSNTTKPWVTPLISAVDQAIIANIFPYWSNATIGNALPMLTNQSYDSLKVAKAHNKDLWLGETGWASQQFNNENVHGATQRTAQQYFNIVGCQIMTVANGTAFYYADWDQDQAAAKKPTFGLFDFEGKPLLNLNCTNYAPEVYFASHPEGMPSWLGGTGIRNGV